MTKPDTDSLVIAIPKGRIAEELLPLLKPADITPEDDFFDEKSRKLRFATNRADVEIIRVRSFDVATFVAFGAAQIGVCGSDVIEEFAYDNILSPLDLKIGTCRLSLAAPNEIADDASFWNASHQRVATKYPNLTSKFFAARGIQAECVKLNGAIELAPIMGLCDRIVDLVSTGGTLKANGLREVETILDVSSKLIVDRVAYKTRRDAITPIITAMEGAL